MHTIRIVIDAPKESATVWLLKAPFRLTWFLAKWTLIVLFWTTVGALLLVAS
jgi:hypothetical protein